MFDLGVEYERNDLLDFVGSKQNQSGIIWGKKDSSVVIVTSGGRHGKMVGYGDEQNVDGSWAYIGQGEKGDQDPYKYSNSLLTNKERSVLFFSTREPNAEEVRERGSHKKLYRFEGVFAVLDWKFVIPESGKRRGDKLIEYQLIPIDSGSWVPLIKKSTVDSKNLFSLRERLKSAELNGKKKSKEILRDYYLRSSQVKSYALLRADGNCEYCGKEAPFVSSSGDPFLEVHHIHRLADQGPDRPENVAALCPNCHRLAHFGLEREKVKTELIQIIQTKEGDIKA